MSQTGVQLLGVSLSGAEDGNPVTGVMNYDYVYPTTAEIDYFASLGLNTIRIPVSWQRLQPTEDGPLSTTQLAQLQTLVAYAATKGITVDIDLHNYGAGYGADVGTAQTPDSAFANFWSQMAATFVNAPNVMFGLMNEPNSITPAAWAVAAQDAVDAIRATGANQEILVSGSDWDTASSWVSSGNAATVGEITDPDNNIAFEVHQYFNPGSTGTNTAVISPDIGPESLAAVTQWAEENGKKLFLGEFGAGSDPASLTALSNTLNYLNANADVWQGGTYWAGGPWMGNYIFSADPQNGAEAPQAAVLAAAAATGQPMTIYSATTAVTTTDTASAMPFSGVIIAGVPAAQNTTATVTLSSALNGTLSDPNAITDGSQIVNGVWTMSGSSVAVAVALDELVFTPAANLVGAAGPVNTTVTAVVGEAGETASTTSTITTGGAVPISITPATEAVATTDAESAAPFAGIVITDPNAGAFETATVTLSSAANGTLSDPKAASDGSTIQNGVWSVYASATAVAAALDGLVFTPTHQQVAPGSTVTTLVTAAIADTAGETAAATSTVTATAVALAISVTPATEAVATTDAASAAPFTGIAIADPNIGQTETATVTLSAAGNGTLSDPNAATDGSTIVGGVWSVSGSATAVATALDGLVFTPTAHQVAPGSAVTTTLTAAIEDTAGETAVATSTITATAVAAPIAVTPASEAVATTDAASADPFKGITIADANAAQTETATVSLSATANGTLSDPNAATDGSTIVDGVWTISGSSTSVAAALAGLVFTPTAHQVAPGNAVTTTFTAAIQDSAGETAVATSSITATAVAAPIAVTPATEDVETANGAIAKPFTGVVITDANAGQTETASVALSAAANGTISDPNAATDGSTIVGGVWTVSGSSAAVAAALDGLEFTPAANKATANAAIVTTVTATVKDTAGETASATSTITAPPATDTIALHISEDAWEGDAEFTVKVNGQQVGGDYTASVLHSSGDGGTFSLTGDWGAGVNDVQVSFINDAYGGSSSKDRNLYVNSISENGVTYANTTAALYNKGTDSFAVGGTTPTASAPADTLTLQLSEDAWQGNAEFVLYIDGKAVTTPQVVTALHDANQTQAFTFSGNLGAGTHTIGVAFVNDAYGGSASEDRNLYIDGITLNGSGVFGGTKAQDSDGTSSFTITTTH